MDAVNVFVIHGTDTFGLLVPCGCSYMSLIGMIASEMGADITRSCIKIEYNADEDMFPIRITSDSSLLFYLELKRRDPRITAYALSVHLTDVPSLPTNLLVLGSLERSVQHSEVNKRTFISMADLALAHPVTNDLISCIEVSALETADDAGEEMTNIATTPDIQVVCAGQVFRDKDVVKKCLALYAIRNNFQYKVYKSDNKEYVLKCLMDNCQWKFRASKIGDTDMFKIRYIRSAHTCSLENIIRDHRQANSTLIGECVKHKYTSARTIYTPNDIMNDMAEMYGVTMKYGKAWRAREHALEAVMGDPDKAYARLPNFMVELKERNHGSVTDIDVDLCGRFKYAFMALGASIQGWKNCKPVVVVNATFLTGRYRGSLFTACTQDANNGIFVLAFGIGDSENNDSWSWFLSKFREAYGERNEMCFISDRHPSIEHAVHLVYPEVMHGFCARHLLQNLRTSYSYSGKNIAKPFNAAARAYTKHEFEYHMRQLDKINRRIRKDLEDVGFHKWSRCHMSRNRYSAMTSNTVESVNSAVRPFKQCPVDYLFEALRHLLQGWFYKNRNIAAGTFTRLTGKQENVLRENAKGSMGLKVSASNEFLHEVTDVSTKHIVNLVSVTCSCNHFQVDGVPCKHALAVIGDKGESPYKYCANYNTKVAYVDTYAGNIVPLGCREHWNNDSSVNLNHILPPNSKRPSGRPKNSRRRTRLESINPVMCGRCGGKGHNKRTCNQPLPLCHVRKRKRGS